MLCIEVTKKDKISHISEELCIGCGICVKKCPFDAISIINLPKALSNEVIHRFGPNAFKLHRLPTPRPGQVLGLVGTNGIGKSTALKILSAKLKPNLGRFDEPPDWSDILTYFRGSELQNYFKRIVEDDLKAMSKPQYVDNIPKAIPATNRVVKDILIKKDKRKVLDILIQQLDMQYLMDRTIDMLSGGELQRFAICLITVSDTDVYLFDEPSSYLDVRQRLRAAEVIRSVVTDQPEKYCIVVEHDLAVLDYLSDFVCVLYGTPGAYGVVTMPFNVRDGINIFLAGFVPTENLRFRDEALTFKISETTDDEKKKNTIKQYVYPNMTKTLKTKASSFTLHIDEGSFKDSEIIVLLGENGTGKTTFIRMLAGLLKSDEEEKGEDVTVPQLNISYKPQKISPKFEGSVRDLLLTKIKTAFLHPQFNTDVLKPLNIEALLDQEVTHLSGGELQRVAITLCLGKPADIYLVDEPSAYLDSEQRIIASKVIKRFILHSKKTGFVVEHDFIMATYLADRVIVYSGKPAVESYAAAPQVYLYFI